MTPLPFLPAPLHIYLYTQLSARLEAEVEAAPGAPPLTAADALLDLLAESGPKANDASMYPVADAISALISCPPVLSDPDMGLQRHIVGRLLKMLGFSFTAAPAAGGSPGSKGGGPSSSRAGGAPNRSASVILPGVSAAGGRMSSHASAHDAPAASAPGGAIGGHLGGLHDRDRRRVRPLAAALPPRAPTGGRHRPLPRFVARGTTQVNEGPGHVPLHKISDKWPLTLTPTHTHSSALIHSYAQGDARRRLRPGAESAPAPRGQLGGHRPDRG